MKNKKVAIIDSENKKIISAVKNTLKDNVDILNKNSDFTDYDIIALTGYETEFNADFEGKEVLNIHPSLLPSFMKEDAITKSYLSGIKVSGVTIHKVEKDNFYGKILAQYPVLIGLETHLEEFTDDLEKVGARLYPPVIEAIINDTVFDFQDLFKNPCNHANGGCSGNCSSCKH